MLQIFRYLEKNHLNIYLLGFLFYFLRSVFPPFKYLFVVFAFLSLVLFLVRDLPRTNLSFLKNLVLPLFLAAFIFIGLLNSQIFYSLAVKEAFNAVIVLFYALLFSLHFKAFNTRFFKWITLSLLFIGGIAIIRFLLLIKGVAIPYSEYFFSSTSDKFSLVSDSNFYSLFFIIGICLSFYLRSRTKISAFYYYFSTAIFLINISLCFSRRGYISLLSVILLLPLALLINKDNIRAALVSFYSLVGVWIFLSVLSIYAFRFQIYKFDVRTSFISNNLYKLNSILDEDEKKIDFNKILWERVSNEFWSKYEAEENNLYYNGSFKYDLEFWSYYNSSNDSITHKIKSEGNDKYLEISHLNGNSFFLQLVYYGRPIYFHKNVKYKLSFDLRVIQGEGVPIRVGWWVIDKGKRISNLPFRLTELSDGWMNCEVEHVFKEDHINPKGFINGQKGGTIINIRDISLTTVDSIPAFVFSDQVPELYANAAGNEDSNTLFNRRGEMWQYALQLWSKEYSVIQKIFGKGFDYLPLYGEKFNDDSDNYTYPHNPIISAFLYSGLIGGFFYVIFLLIVFWLYWIYRKDLFLVFLMYVLTFIFSMFSGNSHFSVHLFALLSFMPFIYTYSIKHKKENRVTLGEAKN